jgi:hypothetical protein
MKQSTRALVGLVLIDLLLLAGIAWLFTQVRTDALHAPDPADAITCVAIIGGDAIGIVTMVLGLTFVPHRRKGN